MAFLLLNLDIDFILLSLSDSMQDDLDEHVDVTDSRLQVTILSFLKQLMQT